jgi:hypothetical protein
LKFPCWFSQPESTFLPKIVINIASKLAYYIIFFKRFIFLLLCLFFRPLPVPMPNVNANPSIIFGHLSPLLTPSEKGIHPMAVPTFPFLSSPSNFVAKRKTKGKKQSN